MGSDDFFCSILIKCYESVYELIYVIKYMFMLLYFNIRDIFDDFFLCVVMFCLDLELKILILEWFILIFL